jgi:hypothetical protein
MVGPGTSRMRLEMLGDEITRGRLEMLRYWIARSSLEMLEMTRGNMDGGLSYNKKEIRDVVRWDIKR